VQKEICLVTVVEPVGIGEPFTVCVERLQHIEMKVGVFREIGHHTRHAEIPSVDVQSSIQGLLPLEIFLGHGLRDHHGVGFLEGGFRIAGCQRKGEHFEKIGIGRAYPVFIEHQVAVFDGNAFEGILEADGVLNLGVVFEQCWCHDGRGVCLPDLGVADHGSYSHALDAVGIFVKAVIAALVAHEQKDQDGAGHSQGEAEYIDKRINLVFEKIPDGDLYVVFQNGSFS